MILHHRAVKGRRREEKKTRRISVVTGPVGAPAIRQTTHISIGSRG
jgi:hypothetical protein